MRKQAAAAQQAVEVARAQVWCYAWLAPACVLISCRDAALTELQPPSMYRHATVFLQLWIALDRKAALLTVALDTMG